MRPMLIFVLIVALLLIVTPFLMAEESDSQLDLARVKWAIRQVEHWDGRSVGAAGELGPWQVRPAVWLQFSEKPLEWAYGTRPEQKAEQERVATELVAWIDVRLLSLHLARSARSIGLVWTVGYGNMKARKISRAKKEYADRVSNTYHDRSQKHPVDSAKSSSSVKPLFRQ